MAARRPSKTSYRGEQGTETERPCQGARDRQHRTGAQPRHPEGPPHGETPGGRMCSRPALWEPGSRGPPPPTADAPSTRRDPRGVSEANLRGFPAPLTSDQLDKKRSQRPQGPGAHVWPLGPWRAQHRRQAHTDPPSPGHTAHAQACTPTARRPGLCTLTLGRLGSIPSQGTKIS